MTSLKDSCAKMTDKGVTNFGAQWCLSRPENVNRLVTTFYSPLMLEVDCLVSQEESLKLVSQE